MIFTGIFRDVYHMSAGVTGVAFLMSTFRHRPSRRRVNLRNANQCRNKSCFGNHHGMFRSDLVRQDRPSNHCQAPQEASRIPPPPAGLPRRPRLRCLPSLARLGIQAGDSLDRSAPGHDPVRLFQPDDLHGHDQLRGRCIWYLCRLSHGRLRSVEESGGCADPLGGEQHAGFAGDRLVVHSSVVHSCCAKPCSFPLHYLWRKDSEGESFQC